MWRIHCGDVLEWYKQYDGELFHAILCDPPYSWGFMSKKWDNDIALRPETWAPLAEHLLPGAFIIAFTGPRTYHRLACAMEDAGLRLHSPLGWVNGQGFPKATNISTLLEKTLCEKRDNKWHYTDTNEEMKMAPPFRHLDADRFWSHRYGLQALKPCLELIAVAQKPYEGKPVDCIVETGAGALNIDGGRIGAGMDKQSGGCHGNIFGTNGRVTPSVLQGRWPPNFAICHSPKCRKVGTKQVRGDKRDGSIRETAKDGSPLARSWKNTSLKGIAIQGYANPDGLETVEAWECVCGCEVCGATWTVEPEGIRIGHGEAIYNEGDSVTLAAEGYTRPNKSMYTHKPDGNLRSYGKESVALHHRGPCPECGSVNTCWLCPVAALDEQTGERSPGNGRRVIHAKASIGYGGSGVAFETIDHGDSGGASRFFYQADWSYETAERLAGLDLPVMYCPKASKSERDAGCEGLEKHRVSYMNTHNGNPEQGNEWEPIDNRTGKQRNRFASNTRNYHPTVKPVSLCKWLAVLLLPPSEYAPRRILVPFAGSGSEMIAAGLAGWDEIIGVELDADYVEIAKARLKHWLDGLKQLEMF